MRIVTLLLLAGSACGGVQQDCDPAFICPDAISRKRDGPTLTCVICEVGKCDPTGQVCVRNVAVQFDMPKIECDYGRAFYVAWAANCH